MMEITLEIITCLKRLMRERLGVSEMLSDMLNFELDAAILEAEAELKQAEADREKQTAKKPNYAKSEHYCPDCGCDVGECSQTYNDYCGGCGQKLDWSE